MGCGLKFDTDLRRQILPDVLPGGDKFSSLPNEHVGRPRALVRHVAGNSKEIPVLLRSAARGNARAGVLRCFHHQNTNTKPAENAVPAREVLWRGECATKLPSPEPHSQRA